MYTDRLVCRQERKHLPAQTNAEFPSEPAIMGWTTILRGPAMGLGASESTPRFRELALHIQEANARTRQVLLRTFVGSFAQNLPTLASREVQVQNQVTNRLHIELVILQGKLDPPAAYGARELKRQIAFIAEIELKHPGVILPARGCDGFGGSVHGDDAAVIGHRLIAVLTALVLTALVTAYVWRASETGIHTGLAAQHRQATVHAGVWSGHTRNRHSNVLDPTHVLAGVVEVEHPFGDFDLTVTSGSQLQERRRKVQAQRKVFGKFILTDILVIVGLFHVAYSELQPLAG